ncbi:hypothetical protein FHX82_005723 [Amycolatopsis bartoniae]|uniref:hypothetical protein n=1 Tax=Amycolatopsis bartoniae TaxID=941986 RepID=UPI001192CF9B|nr:hypothetical protein [Amycolatopsis bartoniae]MBB2938645.1 hypothetical protein [Amycolatopsis bartoniae]TVT08860.1 hypothetical protein FNH07_10785 [Amycolatopsis bartoniae]
MLVAFLVTGLVAPGFLVDRSQRTLAGTGAPATTGSSAPDSAEPQASGATSAAPDDGGAGLALIEAFLRKVSSGDTQDQDAAAGMACPSYRSRVEAFAVFGSGETYSYDPAQATRSGPGVSLPITGKLNGLPYTGVVTATTEAGKRCVTVQDTH